MTNFEVFDRLLTGREGETITVGKRGLLQFSAGAYRRLGDPQAIVFLCDRGAGVLGFRPAPKGSPNAYAVLRAGGGHTRSIWAKGPLAALGIEPDESRRYELRDVGGELAIDLSMPGTPLHKNGAVRKGDQ